MSEVLETIFVHFLFVFLNSLSPFKSKSIIINEIERVSTLFFLGGQNSALFVGIANYSLC